MDVKTNKIILLIRDGWGYSDKKIKNAIIESNTPFTNRLMKEYPHTLIKTSGESVGLPEGYQGNSEVGHITIGSGRINFTPFERINYSIKDKSFFSNKELLNAINNCKKNKSVLHIIGLIQVEGVHSHINHLFALLDFCKEQGFYDVFIHAITDGRDSPVTDSIKNISLVIKKIKSLGFGKIVSVSGRYYTMDRDKRWDRTKIAYDCIVNGECSEEYKDIILQIKKCHENKEYDEFIKPRKITGYSGIKENDSIIFFNYRTDRPRQLTQAIVEKDFSGFKRNLLNLYYVGMTNYYNSDSFHVAFDDQPIKNILGEIISKKGYKQLRISETEKYPHVTFFFNSQNEEPYIGEDRILIPSPKVATYDLKPEMSVFEIADKLVEEINNKKYNLIVTNLVNCDMVGHTGKIEAIKKAIESVDSATEKIVEAGLFNDYTIFIFADHGNAEDYSDAYMTSHTINPVPLILVSNNESLKKASLKKDSGLYDIAPTVLSLMNIPVPKEMTGKNMIIE
jgi:2,3-bisphosphoglycerate-independent phosphoglycerate mutase